MPIDNNKLKKVWDTLRNGGYTQDYKTFVKGFSGDSNYENRKKVYDLLTENGAQIGKDYGEFMSKLHTDTPIRRAPQPKPTPTVKNPLHLPEGFGTVDLKDPMAKVRDANEVSDAVRGIESGNAEKAAAGRKKLAGVSARLEKEREAAKPAMDLLSAPLTEEQKSYVRHRKDAADYQAETGRKMPSVFGAGFERFGMLDADDYTKGVAPARIFVPEAERDEKGRITGRYSITSDKGAQRADRDARQGAIDWLKTIDAEEAEKERLSTTEGKDAEIADTESRIKELDAKMAARRRKLGIPQGGGTLSIAMNVAANADEEYNALSAARRQEELRLRSLKDRRFGGNDDYWWQIYRGVQGAVEKFLGYDTASDLAKYRAAGSASGFDKGVDEARQMFMEALDKNEREQAVAAGSGGLAREFGQLTGNSAIYMLPFMFGGKVIGGIQTLSRAAMRGAVKTAAGQAARKGVASALGRYTKRALGAVAEDMAIGLTGASTVGMPATLGQAAENYAGKLEQDENGRYYYTGGDDTAHAFVTALLSNSFEYSSEMAGEHMESLWKAGKKSFAKTRLGMSIDRLFAPSKDGNRLVRYYNGIKSGAEAWLERLRKTKAGSAAYNAADFITEGGARMFRHAHIQDLPFEGLEEELNNIENAAFQTGQGSWKDVADNEQRWKLWAGLAISMATTGAVFGGISTVQYGGRMAGQYRAKHLMDRADVLARYSMTEEVWKPIKDRLDNADNADMGTVIAKALGTVKTDEERKEILNYARRLLEYRGYNIATTVGAAQGDGGADAGDMAYSEGYETTDANDMHNIKTRYEEARRKVEADGVNPDETDVRTHIEMMLGARNEDGTPYYTDEEVQPYIDYLNAKAAFDGSLERVRDDIDSGVAESEAAVDRRTGKDGMVHPAVMKQPKADGTERSVYILAGNVEFTGDGGVVIDPKDTRGSIVVCGEDGTMEMVSPDAIREVGDAIDPETEKEEAAEAVRQRIAQDAADKFDNTPKYGVNDTFVMTGADGTPVSGVVQRVSEDGVEAAVGGRVALIPTEQFEAAVQEVRDAYGNVSWRRTPEDAAEADVQENGENVPNTTENVPNTTESVPNTTESVQGTPGNAPQDLVEEQKPEAAVQENGNSDAVGRSLSESETETVISEMKSGAQAAPEMELNPKNWLSQFGEDGVVTTPIGNVKMGENQYFKLAQRGRDGKLGMVKPTLETPDVIVEDSSKAKENGAEERPSSYVFVKTFTKADGSRYYHFTSVTVSKDGGEVVVSNQEKSENRISRLLRNGRIVWIDAAFSLHPTAQDRVSVPLGDSNRLTPTDSQSALLGVSSPEHSAGKDTEQNSDMQAEGGENASALSLIPKDANGEPVYTAADAYTAWDALVEQCGGDAGMAQGVADSMVKDMETALKKAEKSAPAHGVTVAEKIAAAKGHKAAVEKARTELEKWRAIAGETASRARAAEEAERRRKKERLDAAREELRRNGRYAKEDAALGDYTDFADYAMRTIATGKYRFLWGDRESGTQGLGAHLGFTGSRTERNKRIWLLSKDGFTPEEAAERMLADYSAAAGFDSVGDTGVDSMEALDVILDVLRRYTSPRAMMDDAKAAHAENGESAEERRQGEEYERGQFMEAYHMTPEEYYEYENEWLPRYMEEAAQVPQEVIDNINAEYAETYSENGKDDYNGGEDARGVPPVQGERLDKPGGDEGGGDTGGAAGAVGKGDAAGGFVPQGASGREVRAGEVPQPVGKGAFGDIYDQFRGDAKAAFDFLTKHRSGDLLGVFHRDDTGDIDLVWGDENSGLSHILTKHVGKGKDFGTEQAAFDKIESILKNGKLIQDGRLRYVVSEDGYRVAIRKDYDGVKKNWIVTAVDYNRSKEEKEITTNPTSASHGANGSELAAPNNSKGKVTEESADLQENGGKDAGGKAEMPLSEQIDAASAEVNTEPTEAQKEAGNYKKGHVQVGMFDITIEQPEGSIRRGTDAAGKQWESKMHNTYGYFRGTEGVDGDHIDVFLSNDIDGWNGRKVFVVDQYNPDGTFDEHKVMLGFNDMDEAKGDYLANYEKGWENGRRIDVSAVNLEDFEKWIGSSHRKTKPFAEYAGVKKETETAPKATEGKIDGAEAHFREMQAKVYPLGRELGEKFRNGEDTGDVERRIAGVLEETTDRELEGTWRELTENTGENPVRDIAAKLVKAEIRRRKSRSGKKETPRFSKVTYYSAFAEQYGLDEGDVAMYAEGMRKGSSAQAARALAIIGSKIVAEHEAEIHSLRDMRKFRRPVEKALKETFGDVDKLVEEYRQRTMDERNAMEAARKKAAEDEAVRKRHLEELSLLSDAELDERYMDAVSKDDKAVARETLDEAARRKGYGDAGSGYQGEGSWKAPSNPGYESDAARRADIDNNPDVNIEDMALGYSMQPEDYFTHPERYSQNTPHGLESTRAIRAALEALKRGEKDVKVRVFRAVPVSVKEGKLRNGDWVTPSRKYAEMHGEHRLEGKYRIIEDEVPASELWWDGNDANEFGYDNGREYKYKNARNSRKLDDLVTRDDEGNIIPPSKRFNPGKADERYHRPETVRKPTREERVLRDAVIDRLRENGMEVITDVAEGQRVLDMADGAVREHRVYHGSGADFDAFDHSHMGEGEGAQAYGWGTYVTEVKGIGRMYAEQNPGKVEYTDSEREEACAEIAEKVLARYGNADCELEVLYDGAGGFEIFDIPGDKEVLEQFREYFKNHEDEFEAWDIDDYDLDTEDGRKDFADAVERSMIDYAVEVAHGYDYLWDGGQRMLYTIEIPDDTGENYFGWNSRADRVIDRVGISVEEYEQNGLVNGEDVYRYLSQKLGSDKAASEHLRKAGYVGIKYPAEYRSGGRRDGAMNYVIFDEDDLKITDKVRFFRTENGEAYGFTVGGKIYIDPGIANAETPVHEYAHLWASALRAGNAKEWGNVVGLMKGTAVWDEVKKRYPELKTDDEIADEVLAHYSGRRGAERLREEVRRITAGNGGVFEKAETVSALERVKDAIGRFWQAVADFLHIHYTSAEEVADRVMKDLLDGVDPGKFGKGGVAGELRFNARQKRALETVSVSHKGKHLQTAISSADGAKVLNNLDNLAKDYDNSAQAKTKTLIGDVANALGINAPDMSSKYATFETKNGRTVTIRLSNHNATVSNFDRNGEADGISIVVTPKRNAGVTNDGNAHVTEYYYDAIKLRKAGGKPLAEIVRSIRQTLYSGEFRDTTGLAEVQEVNAGDAIRFQFTGERGAEAADRAEEVTVRLDNLSVAREMEKSGKDAKAVKMATGWERGADGKWRYETGDVSLWDGLRLTKRGTEERTTFGEMLEDSREKEELLAAYPQLKAMPLVFKDMGYGEVGYYDGKEIVLNSYLLTDDSGRFTENASSVLAHEIQHAIQHIEGFSMGATPEEMRSRKFGRKYEDYLYPFNASQLNDLRFIRSRAEGYVKSGKYKRMHYAVLAAIKEYKEHGLYPAWAEADEYMDFYAREALQEVPSEIMIEASLVSENEAHAEYMRKGGEVEARNVQRRIGMTPEERRASLAAETEDVAREDQIFLERELGGAGASMAEAPEERTDKDLERVNEEFNERLDEWQEGTLNASDYLDAGLPNGIIAQFMPDAPIIIRQKVLRKSAKKHGLSASDMKDLPKAMRSPIFIFKSSESTISILTELKSSEGRNIFVAVELGKEKQMGHRFIEVNDILTIHGRETENVINPIVENDSLVWADKEKGLNWLSSAKSKSQAIANEVLDTAANVVRNFENPKVSDEKMAEKEKKYAEMDASVEAATDVAVDVEDDTPGGDAKFRSMEMDVTDVADEERDAMTARVNELAERLHTPVRIIRTDEEVAALPSTRQRRMKGSFNPMTGEVTIVVPNNANMADVENTFLHEVVGHDGLRVLFPDEEKLNNALDELYRVSKDGIQDTIDRMARKMYDAEVDRLMRSKRREHEASGGNADAHYFTNLAEAHVEADRKRGKFKRDATEEYGADLAGRIGEKGFEKMSAEELTFWGRLKAVLQNALRKLAEGLGIPSVRKWGDNEWAFVLHEAYKRKRNDGRPSVADAADTVAARESSGFDGELYRVGDVKAFRDGSGIEFRRKPTATFNALLAHLEKEGVKTERHKARTGSEYASFSRYGVMYEVRNADHTKAKSADRRAEESGVEVTDWDGMIRHIDMDLVQARMNAADVYALMDEAERFNSEDEAVRRAATEDGVGSAEFRDAYPTLWRVMGLKSPEEARMEHLRKKYADEYYTARGKELDKLYPFTASNGVTIGRGRKFRVPKSIVYGKGDARRAAEEEFDKAYKKVYDEFIPLDEFVRQREQEGNLDEVNRRFNEQLQLYRNGEMDKNEMLRLGRPQGVMRAFLPNLPIVMRQRILTKGSVRKHNVSVEALANMPKHLAHPIFVFKRSDNALGVLTEMQDRDGKNICVAIELNRQIQNGGEILEVNDIRSVHGRNVSDIVYPIVQNGTLEWADKEKGLAYLSSASRYVQQEIDKQDLDTAANVVRNFENPKVSDGKASDEDLMFRDGDDTEYKKALARDIYERRVSRGLFQTQEALQDSMLGLKEAMDAILKAEGKGRVYIEDVAGFENAYLGENRLSSVNQAECSEFGQRLFKPLLKEAARLAKTAEERAELTDYMMAKHGLERNEVMARRDARKKAREELAKELAKAEKSADKNAVADVKQRMKDRENELYKENRKRDYAGLTALTGMPYVGDAEDEARRMVADYEREHAVKTLWDRVNAVNAATLLKSYESGMISRETYDDIRGMYKNYIPLRGFDEKTAEDAYAYVSSEGRGGFNAPIRTAKGRKSKADDPFANMEAMAESAIMQGNRNVLVKQRFMNFAVNHPSDLVSISDLWLWKNDATGEWQPLNAGGIRGTEAIGEDDTPAEVARKMRDFEAAVEQAAKDDPEHFRRQKENPAVPYRVVESRDLRQHQVIVRRNGRDYVLTINGNPRAAQALNGLTNPDNDISGVIGKLMRFGEKVNRELSAFYTTRNPDFVVSNFLRDMMYANTMVWVKETPNYAVRFHMNVLKLNPAKMKLLLAKFRKGTLNDKDETERMFRQFMMNGGETGYSSVKDIDRRKNDIRRELKKYNGKIPLQGAYTLLGERLDEYNRAVENCARFAAFMTSRQMMRSIDRSVYDAKEISVNFNKKGSGAKFIDAKGQTRLGRIAAGLSGAGRSLYVFFNAAIQGTANYARQFRRHPVKALTGAAVMYLLGTLMAHIGGSGDDDDEKGNSYWDLPEWTRRSNIMFRAGGQWISIPLPVEYRVFYGMGELAVSAIEGREQLTPGELASAVAAQLSQALPIDLLEGGGGLHALWPSIVKPGVEAYTNTSWTGLPIYRKNDFNKNDPEWTKAYRNTNKYLVAVAEKLNEATGGDKYTKGAVDINPAQVEYLLNGYFGGVSGTVDKLVKSAETLAGQREYDPRNFLLLNRVVKKGDERTAQRAVNNEYERMKHEYKVLGDRLRGYRHDTTYGIFDFAEKANFIYNSPEYMEMMEFNACKKAVDKCRTLIKNSASPEDAKGYEEKINGMKRDIVERLGKTKRPAARAGAYIGAGAFYKAFTEAKMKEAE